MKKYFFTILLFIVTLSANAQNKKAVKSFKKAEQAMALRDLSYAKSELLRAIDLSPKYGDAHYMLAYLYVMERNHKKAREHYEKTVNCCGDNVKFSLAYLNLANYTLREGDYASAKKYAEDFKALVPNARGRQAESAQMAIRTSIFALEQINKPVPIQAKSLGEVFNQQQQQYFPVVTGDGEKMYFTARNERADENIYESVFEDGKWGEPTLLTALNTPYNEGTCSISADGRLMIFTFCRNTKARPSMGGCDLFFSRKVGDKWTQPENMGREINTRFFESQPALSADGRKLFFVSDREGGFGGRDIWMSELQQNGKWKKPVNLGGKINTSQDDLSPFLHVNGTTLYFSSVGHLGMGGLDIYQSEWDGNNWTEPKNLGYPINDHKEQVSLFVTADGTKAYYSMEKSSEFQGATHSDIAYFDLPPSIQAKPSGFVKGNIYDEETKKPLKAYVEVKNLQTEDLVSAVYSDKEQGDYLVVLTKGQEYGMHVSRPNYLFKSLSFDYRDKEGGEGLVMDIYLTPIKKGAKVTLNNIFFEHASFELMDKSKSELDEIAMFLQKNKDYNIEISGHTDNVGAEKDNQKLSQKRADSVVAYLTKKGIAPERLKAVGYGEKDPIVPNDSEEHKAQNRRIEFKVL